MAVKAAALTYVRAQNADQSLYQLADYPVLEKLARVRTTASQLDGRACRFIYETALHEIDITSFSHSERHLFDAFGMTPFQKC